MFNLALGIRQPSSAAEVCIFALPDILGFSDLAANILRTRIDDVWTLWRCGITAKLVISKIIPNCKDQPNLPPV
jgi:hypothetical protein